MTVSNAVNEQLYDVIIPRRDDSEPLWVKTFPRFNVSYKLIHRHQEFEICYCPDNSGKFFINDKEYDIEPGDIFIVNGGEYHQPIYDTKENNGAIVVYFRPDFVSPYHTRLAWMNVFLHASSHGLNRIGKNAEIANLMRSLGEAFASRKTNWRDLCWGILSHILVLIEDQVVSTSDNRPKFTNDDNQARFNHVVQHIKQHMHQPIRVGELYEISSLSKSQFSVQFKKTFKCTVTQFISRERCSRAAALLKGSNKSISDIAYHCGFNSLSYFNRQFRHFHSESPTDFRARY